MKELYRHGCVIDNITKIQSTSISFSKVELEEYYKSIRNNSDISDSYKLKIANAIIDMR